jgi:hypothetical protein
MEQVVGQWHLPKGEPVVRPAPPSPPACEADSLVLQLTARYVEDRGGELVPLDNQSVLGTKAGGNWGDLPSQDWIVLSRVEAAKLLPPARPAVAVGTAWQLNHEVAAKLLKHFFPPTENTDFEKNRIDQQALYATVEVIEPSSVRARIEGRFRMKHAFYHQDDDYFVDATLVGHMEFEPRSQRVASLRLVTDQATYGEKLGRPHTFGVAVRSMP